jgi:hypothetical protein
VSIPPLLYEQLLLAQILKAQNNTDDLTVFLHFWDLGILKHLKVKSTPSVGQTYREHTS